ncbi:Hypothetical protein SMAX5B_002033 [Scophthalmus maximus]|uniref:Uncharacterized protein n=1 Tax=Scophthalmus maximus TaxID=52904 RepID=A0A2U9BRC4_SCOMX|nr:Hypothetical protein SMAX5B_002033 [Scophthalmus maximus]
MVQIHTVIRMHPRQPLKTQNAHREKRILNARHLLAAGNRARQQGKLMYGSASRMQTVSGAALHSHSAFSRQTENEKAQHLRMTLLYRGVPLSHDSVAMSPHGQYSS